jgi:hypothetical protein
MSAQCVKTMYVSSQQTQQWRVKKKEEEGLQGVFKQLCRNGHQLEKGCCEQLSSDCHSKGG